MGSQLSDWVSKWSRWVNVQVREQKWTDCFFPHFLPITTTQLQLIPLLLFVFKLTNNLIECSMSGDRLSLYATTCWRPWGKWRLYSPPHMLIKAAVILLFSIFPWQWITFASYLLSLPETKARLCCPSKCEYWLKLIIEHVLKLPSGQTITMCFIWLSPSYSWNQLQEDFVFCIWRFIWGLKGKGHLILNCDHWALLVWIKCTSLYKKEGVACLQVWERHISLETVSKLGHGS